MVTIASANPHDPLADRIVRAYMVDVASRWYGRPATAGEVDRALRDEPYDDLQGTSGVLFVAVDGDEPVGCAGVRFVDGVAELTKVFTLPAHRGRGVGSRLLCEVEGACRARSIGTLRLDTRAALAEACSLYERSGFERVEPFNDEPYSDRWYCKTLVASAGDR
ncbi:GNAT family N-acetyltransferase [Curtobacterium sp. 9128]|uniref:GNAT family N-acetyltransferase n=1 Tax=Curtobacterium sp. 9128 TaxID=1793722 RepID=UPI001C92FEFB|nr:GNAT family N-acetyltransferase [Curtobacterium sp. 9128]